MCTGVVCRLRIRPYHFLVQCSGGVLGFPPVVAQHPLQLHPRSRLVSMSRGHGVVLQTNYAHAHNNVDLMCTCVCSHPLPPPGLGLVLELPQLRTHMALALNTHDTQYDIIRTLWRTRLHNGTCQCCRPRWVVKTAAYMLLSFLEAPLAPLIPDAPLPAPSHRPPLSTTQLVNGFLES